MIAIERDRHNLLHSSGLHYILASAFAPSQSPLKQVPSTWYFGIDGREYVTEGQTLALAASKEPESETYQRLKISEGEGFSWGWVENKKVGPKIFTIKGLGQFIPKDDWGEMRNYFLTNAEKGTDGIIISSIPMKHAYHVDEGFKLKIDYSLDLRENSNNK